MDSRHTADYDLYGTLDEEDARTVLAKAQEFVEEVKRWLQERNLL